MVPSATVVLERLHSSAVDSRPVSHTTSLAQLISELLIARDTLATGRLSNAPWVTTVNSQMLSHATTLAQRKSNSQNATLKPNNARSAKKDQRAATPPLSVVPLVESHTENATQALESAPSATQPRTRTAPKLKLLVTKNAESSHSPSVTNKESAKSALKVTDVSQLPLVRRLAPHTTKPSTSATGKLPTQPAWRPQMVP